MRSVLEEPLQVENKQHSEEARTVEDALADTCAEMIVSCDGRMAACVTQSFTQDPGRYALVAHFASVPDELAEGLAVILQKVTDNFMEAHYGSSVSPTIH